MFCQNALQILFFKIAKAIVNLADLPQLCRQLVARIICNMNQTLFHKSKEVWLHETTNINNQMYLTQNYTIIEEFRRKWNFGTAWIFHISIQWQDRAGSASPVSLVEPKLCWWNIHPLHNHQGTFRLKDFNRDIHRMLTCVANRNAVHLWFSVWLNGR